MHGGPNSVLRVLLAHLVTLDSQALMAPLELAATRASRVLTELREHPAIPASLVELPLMERLVTRDSLALQGLVLADILALVVLMEPTELMERLATLVSQAPMGLREHPGTPVSQVEPVVMELLATLASRVQLVLL